MPRFRKNFTGGGKPLVLTCYSSLLVLASGEFLGQRDDDGRRASHVAESVLVFVLGHLADEFGAVGAQASDSVVDALDCKHDAPQAQRVRRRDRRFELDQFWIVFIHRITPISGIDVASQRHKIAMALRCVLFGITPVPKLERLKSGELETEVSNGSDQSHS